MSRSSLLAILIGIALLGWSAGGVSSMSSVSSQLAAAPQQPQTRFVDDRGRGCDRGRGDGRREV